MKSPIPIESNIHPFEGYTHSEIVNEINTLINIIDINEFESMQDIIDYINESYKVFDRTIPQDIVQDIIKSKCNKKYIVNDTSSEDLYEKILDSKIDYIKNVPQPEQRTKAWFDMRNNMITASSGATALGENPYEKVEGFIMEKVFGREFMDNEFVHHGKKYESIATMLYEHLKNQKVDEYGLIQHPKFSFLGASPDGICSKHTLDGDINLKNYGRMVEIKCPFKRKINMHGPIDDHICPHYYWIQIQLQLECCDLEYCDFWQCDIREYTTIEEWMKPVETNHRIEQNLLSGIEDEWAYGFVLQYKMDDYKKRNDTDKEVFCSKYIYAENHLGNYQDKILLANKMKEENNIPGFTFDKVLYWRIVNSHCCEIKRDRKWFQDKFPIFQDVWERIKYLRKDKEAGMIFRDAILAKKEENKERYANRKNKTIFESKIDDKIDDPNNELKNITVSPVKIMVKPKKVESWF
jgi:putative phage-type endonuclease